MVTASPAGWPHVGQNLAESAMSALQYEQRTWGILCRPWTTMRSGDLSGYAMATVKVAERALDGVPETDASSELTLSRKTSSDVFAVGFDPRDAYTPVA